MPMFSWVQNKLLNGRSRTKKSSSISPPTDQNLRGGVTQREEFSDWPTTALLAIGTFGLKSMKDESLQEPGNHPDSEQTTAAAQDDEADQHAHTTSITPPTPMMVQIKDIGPSDTAAFVAKKSFSYLLKKFFACGGGRFAVPGGSPLIRDPLPHSESRMEKILRKILEKKVHPQGPYSAASATKYLKGSTDDDDDDEDDNEDHDQKAIQYNSKWVKTDTDYIVLEV